MKEQYGLVIRFLWWHHTIKVCYSPRTICFEFSPRVKNGKENSVVWCLSYALFMIHSFYAGKMQHSVWVAEAVSNHEVANANLASAVPADVFPKQFSFHRIWQGKGAQTAACKVSMCPYWSLVFSQWKLDYRVSVYKKRIVFLLHFVLIWYIPISLIKQYEDFQNIFPINGLHLILEDVLGYWFRMTWDHSYPCQPLILGVCLSLSSFNSTFFLKMLCSPGTGNTPKRRCLWLFCSSAHHVVLVARNWCLIDLETLLFSFLSIWE